MLEEFLSPVVAALLILASWPVVLTVMKRICGWAALEQRYPARTGSQGEKYRFSSVAFRKGSGVPFNYGACITVTAGRDGLGFSTFFPFSLSHQPFFIPWTAVTEAARTKLFFTSGTALSIKSFDRSLIVWDFAGYAILEECKKNGVRIAG